MPGPTPKSPAKQSSIFIRRNKLKDGTTIERWDVKFRVGGKSIYAGTANTREEALKIREEYLTTGKIQERKRGPKSDRLHPLVQTYKNRHTVSYIPSFYKKQEDGSSKLVKLSRHATVEDALAEIEHWEKTGERKRTRKTGMAGKNYARRPDHSITTDPEEIAKLKELRRIKNNAKWSACKAKRRAALRAANPKPPRKPVDRPRRTRIALIAPGQLAAAGRPIVSPVTTEAPSRSSEPLTRAKKLNDDQLSEIRERLKALRKSFERTRNEHGGCRPKDRVTVFSSEFISIRFDQIEALQAALPKEPGLSIQVNSSFLKLKLTDNPALATP